MRVGFGYDVHQLVEERKLVLGGVVIPFERGLLGHSDADVLSHAIADALLGSVALGDIGIHFPDTDDAYSGISSLLLLAEVAGLVRNEGYAIGNIDATVVMERPKLAPHIPVMRKNIAESLGIQVSQVSVKATTSEKMGFVGEEKGVAAYACALVELQNRG
jgi:2-C-methyl-D-erythritol 2,4-cyclodiphosphate synthase